MNEVQKSSRNEYIDYLRGLLILLVIQGHTIQYFVYSNKPEFFSDPFFKIIYTFHMPLFMAVSGFVSFNSINNKPAYKSIFDRLKQLIIPILCLSIVSKVFEYCAYAYFRQPSVDDFFQILLYSIAYDFFMGFWFLWSVFGSTVIVVILKKLNFDNLIYFILASLLVDLLPEFGNLYLFKFIFPFFCFGYFCAKKKDILSQQQITTTKIILSILISIVGFFLWKDQTYIYISKMHLVKSNYFNIIIRYIDDFVFSYLFIILSLALFRRYKIVLINEIGKNSLAIYIIQVYCVEKFFTLYPIYQNHINLKLLISPFISIFMCLIAHYFSRFIYRYSLISKLFLGTYLKPKV